MKGATFKRSAAELVGALSLRLWELCSHRALLCKHPQAAHPGHFQLEGATLDPQTLWRPPDARFLFIAPSHSGLPVLSKRT